MAFFEDLNTKTIKVRSILFSNQNLLKYIYYSCAQNENPLQNPDITNPKSTLWCKYIFPMPKIPDANTGTNTTASQVTYLTYDFGNGKPWEPNSGFESYYLYFNVISHIDQWPYSMGIREYSILSEIDKMFNNQNIPELSDNRIFREGWSRSLSYSQYFYGYQVAYKLTSNSNVVLKM